MSQFILDMFFALIFILFLILLARIKDKTFIENKESYRYTTSGIFVLLIVSFLRLLDNQQFFNNVPFLSEAVYRDLAEAIGIVAGAAFLIAGVAIWLPVRRKNNRKMQKHLSRYSCLEKIEEEILNNTNIERLFEVVPEMVCHSFDFNSAIVFRAHNRSHQVICTNCINPREDINEMLTNFQNVIKIDGDDFFSMGRDFEADYCMQLKVRDEIKAAIYFWKGENTAITNDDRSHLDGLGHLLSLRLTEHFQSGELWFLENHWQQLNHIKGILARKNKFEGNIRQLYLVMKGAVGAEYMSLAIMDKSSQNFKRYTIGVDQRVLLEDGHCAPTRNTQVEIVSKTRRSLLLEDVTSFGTDKIESLFISCDQRSMIAVPIINCDRVIGVLTIGHSRAGKFNRFDLKWIETAATAMAPAIEYENARRGLFEKDRYIGAISAFTTIVQDSPDFDCLYKSAAEILLETLNTTMVRISTFDRESRELYTRAVKTIRPISNINQEKVLLSADLVPWHHLAMQESQLLLINQNDPASSIGQAEAGALLFSGVQSAMIIPITINNLLYGFISLGEMRGWDRFSYDPTSILFCKEIAARIADGIKTYQLSRVLLKSGVKEQSLSKTAFARHELLNELKSPATTLKGSLDLLKMKSIGGGISSRLIGALDDSTNKIIELIGREESLS